MKKSSNRPRVVGKGKTPPASGITKGKKSVETLLQKLLKGWPPKQNKK